MSKLPPQSVMYRALVDRDSTFEGVFFVGVRTTGIFCRPTCPARKPKAENVEYFPSAQDALYAGYRPCSRCAPMEKDKRAPDLVRRLCALAAEDGGERITSSRLTALGIDPSTARRQFQRYYGMTFHAYQRARRMGSALHDIRRGESVIGAQIEHGYDSASGFFDAFRDVFGAAPSRAAGVSCLLARWIDTPLGAMLAIADSESLRLLEFVDRRALEQEISLLRRRTNAAVVPGDNPTLARLANELARYFDGSLTAFSVPVKLTGSPFETAVWECLRTIPPGETHSYAEIAALVGSPAAVRAVGRANGRNSLAIIVPCHRVIRSDGALCGYGGGVWRKQWLLDHEQRVVASAPEHR